MRRVILSTGGSKLILPTNKNLNSIFTIFSLLILLLFPAVHYAFTPAETVHHLKTRIITKALQSNNAMIPCPGGSGVVGGKVIGDFNYNGADDQTGGIRNVEIVISSCDADGNSVIIGSTFTDREGNFFMDGLDDGQKYRLDFIAPPGFFPGFGGVEAGTDIQFTTAPNCDIIAAFTTPEDFCDEDPTMLATCFVNGDPLPSNSEANPIDVLVAFPHSSSGRLSPPSKWVTAGQAGSVYGLAYDRFTRSLYTSAFLKRHVGMGPLGLGGIYKIDNSNPMPLTEPFVDVNNIGINVGSIPSNNNRGLPTRLNQPSNDAEAYGKVGKAGIGAIDVSYDGKVLWMVNLHDKKVYTILTDADNNPTTPPTASDVSSFSLPPAGCQGGTFRPFAVKIHRGDVYVGGVCDAALSQDSMDLEAIVYRLNQNAFTEVLRFSLGYDKGWAASQNQCDFFPGWYAWTDQIPVACDQGPTRVYPQPILSDIEFDVDGSMILGFMDRLGHQLGNKNYPLSGTSPLLNTISGGDLLRAYLEDNGEFSIENNGSAGPVSTGGVGNGEGPGGGEFYYRDVFEGQINNLIPPPHAETSQGGLAFLPGSGEVATTALDPYSTVFNSGGINWMNNETGAVRNPGYMLYRSASSSIQSFSKANGLGDLELACGLAPIQLGGVVWNDANANGIQDPCENPLSDIKIALYSQQGNRLGTTTSNAKGEYYFEDSNVSQGLQLHTNYYVVFGVDGQFDTGNFQLNGNYFITVENTGMAPIADRTDSDITLALAGIANNAFNLQPYLEVRTGTYGWVDHSFDAGFTPENLNPVAGIGGYVWEDENQNGLQDSNESGIANVEVSLYSTTFGLEATTSTAANGTYYFSNVDNGTYYVYFESPNRMVGTIQNAGNGSNDSDPNAVSGSTANFQFNPIDGDVNDIDAGFFKPRANLEGYVWEDSNENGLQDISENGIPNTTVNLLGNTGTLLLTTNTDANGNYTFNDLLEGNYRVEFVQPVGMTGTLQNAGNGTNDSDPDPSTGRTNIINLDPFSGDVGNIDAGFFTPTGSISGYVWQDDNRDGLQSSGELPIEGVTVSLIEGSSILATTTTANNGTFAFHGIVGGNYRLVFDVSTNTAGISSYTGTAKDAGNDTIDSDADPQTGSTDPFIYDPQAGSLNFDAGYILPTGSIAGLAFKDCNKNGTRDANEQLLSNIEVILSGTRQETTTTNTNGRYAFDDLETGNYQVQFIIPQNSGLVFTTQNQGADDTIDSDVDNGGISAALQLAAGEDLSNLDAGFIDDEAPVLSGVPNDETLDCGDPAIGNPPVVTATDNCDANVLVQFDEETITLGGNCSGGFQVIRSWTATDNCGNTTVATQAITVTDTSAPDIQGVPSDLTVDCSNIPNVPLVVKAIDNCDADPVLTFSETLNGNCPQLLTRIWTATDNCGNTATVSQVITIVDDTPPQIMVHHPALQGLQHGDTLIVDCNNLPDLSQDDAEAIDDCGNTSIRFVEDVYNAADCKDEGFITLMNCGWIASDDCGNTSEVRFYILVQDRIAPVLSSNIPGDITVDLVAGDTLPDPANGISATDNCDQQVEIRLESSVDQGICQYVLTRIWIAEDDCGNTSSASQNITVLQSCDCPDASLRNVDIQAACGNTGGTALVNVDGVVSDYDVVWIPNLGTTTNDPFYRTDLPAGNYLVIISHPVIDDCDDKIYFTIEEDCSDPCPDIFDEVYVEIELADCADSAMICMNIEPGELADWQFNLNGQSFVPDGSPCSGDPSKSLVVLPEGKHWLMAYNLTTGCADTIDVVVNCPQPCPNIFDEVYVEIEVQDCADSAYICADILPANLSDWNFNLNSVAIQPDGRPCAANPLQSLIALPVGKHWLMVTNYDTGCADTIDVVVNCPADPCKDFELFSGDYEEYEVQNCDDSLMFCLPVLLADLGNYTLNLNGSTIQPGGSGCPGTQYASLALPIGKYWLIINEHITGCADTLDIDISCTQAPNPCDTFDLFEDSWLTLELDDCKDLAEVCLPVTDAAYDNYAWSVNGNSYTDSLGVCSLQKTTYYSYLGMLNIDPNGPYIIDQWDVNDVAFFGQVANEYELVDFLNQYDPVGHWTLDTVNFIIAGGAGRNDYGSIRIRSANGGGTAILEANTNILTGSVAWYLGEGEHQIISVDKASGCADTLEVAINCDAVQITTDTLFLGLEVGEEATLCFDDSELPGLVVSDDWACGLNCVVYDLVAYENLCLTVIGIQEGASANRMTLCDDRGYCDETVVIITVIDPGPGPKLPEARPDVKQVPFGTPVVIEVLNNDSINGTFSGMYLLEGPEKGALVQNAGNTFTYVPPFTFCGTESFVYELCNENGCDTALVTLDVACNDLQIMTGFSPNGDNINETFTILGIEQHPVNQLLIFNRWGNLVYEAKSYQNDWNGTHNGEALPDGTYYYIFKYDEAQKLSGYLEIQR